jgi:adenosylmethionine-8-amino-7-oxononanoate aminotransferase
MDTPAPPHRDAAPAHLSPVWHPFTQHGLGQPVVEIATADGAYLVTADGRHILDAISSWWVTTHGHRHPTIVAAVRGAAHLLDQVIMAGFTHAPAEALARALIDLAPRAAAPGSGQPRLAHVFYSDSGSTAVEVGIKMALGHWRNRGVVRTRILALDHAYHGDTVGTMSAGARGVFTAPYAPLLFDVGRLPFPDDDRPQATIDALDAACRAGDVAALLLEPLILGAGGMLTYGVDILAEMARVCRHHGVLLIADEVMTGWGRTGTLWACAQAGVVPDILCTGKGLTGGSLPLAATLATADIFASHLSADRARMLFHSSSFTANPIACAAALANVEVWRTEPVAARIAALCEAQDAGLARFAGDCRFTALRRCGTITALDLASGSAPGYLADVAPRLMAFFLDRDILLRPLGATIYVLPPYCTTAADLARVYDAIDAAADRFACPP